MKRVAKEVYMKVLKYKPNLCKKTKNGYYLLDKNRWIKPKKEKKAGSD